MAPSLNEKRNQLVERIKSLPAELDITTAPDIRNKLHDELGESTKELVELVLRREGSLKSPLE